MGLTGDQIAVCISLSLMLLFFVHRLGQDRIPGGQALKMVAIWVLIIVVVTVVVYLGANLDNR